MAIMGSSQNLVIIDNPESVPVTTCLHHFGDNCRRRSAIGVFALLWATFIIRVTGSGENYRSDSRGTNTCVLPCGSFFANSSGIIDQVWVPEHLPQDGEVREDVKSKSAS
jgi:hypothetical protein